MSSRTPDPWAKARLHLRRRDAVLKPIITRVGPCTLQRLPDLYAALVFSIIAQQISTKAATSIRTKLINGPCGGILTPAKLLSCSEQELRGAGLSAGKLKSILDLSNRVASGALKLDELDALSDEEVIEQLIPVHGIGRWTAQMFLIFSLGRPDVLPVDDFGLKNAVMRGYGLTQMPDRTALEARGEAWKPFRSIATWYLWRSLDGS